ncbi:MAG: PhzF family phenazine biosynthesis protein, partial [Planctomycetota bacterium]
MAALIQVDAFTDKPFGGNPAAVCLLDQPAEPGWMQQVAAEMNLSETAFVHPTETDFALRWFTPAVEVELCGHATLASAHAMWSEGLVPTDRPIRFATAGGELTAQRTDGLIELNFPATPAEPIDVPDGLAKVLGGTVPEWCGRNHYDKLLVVASEEELRGLQPDFATLKQMTDRGMIVSSPSRDTAYDFVSRYFAPAAGIDEDPVTGSAHCTLAPYWAERLGKRTLVG